MLRNDPVPLLHTLDPGAGRQHLKASFISRNCSGFGCAESSGKRGDGRISTLYLIDVGRVEGSREGSQGHEGRVRGSNAVGVKTVGERCNSAPSALAIMQRWRYQRT